MRPLLITLVAAMLSLSLADSADAQRQRDRGDGEERSGRNSNDERSGRNSSNDERQTTTSTTEERGSRNSSDEGRSSRWSRGNWNNGNGGGRSARSSESRGGGPGFGDQYAIITERNIFLRDRRRQNETPDRFTRGGPPRTPEQTFVLTGVVIEDNEFHVYMEDVSRRTIQKLTVGAAIARGKIAAVDIDAIAYESGGKVTWITVGSNLTGTAVGSVSDERVNAALYSGGSNATAPAPGAPLPDASNPNLTMEERMRLRRAIEMNPGAALPSVPQGEGNTNEEPANEGQPQVPQPDNAAAIEQPTLAQPAPDNSGLSLEEQMRLRRQQELGR